MNRTAIVTGSANGIGKAIATAYAEIGYNVVIADIDFENGKKLSKTLQNEHYAAEFVACDVSDPDAIEHLVS
jgi:NAD(P)-dependent dehydrogenase (short-subunit alcohol dehydrogenase family)